MDVSPTLNSEETASQDPSVCSLRESSQASATFYFFSHADPDSGPPSNRLTPKPLLLFYHFFSVAFYSIYILFTRGEAGKASKPGFGDYPGLVLRSGQVVSSVPFDGRFMAEWPKADVVFRVLDQFYTACVVLLPVIWSEIRL